jgi:hypothetical protein
MKKMSLLVIMLFCLITPVYAAPHDEDEDLCKAVIARLLYPQIQSEINKYYEKVLKSPPQYAPFYGAEITVTSASTNRTTYSVTVVVMPYVGAHISVGVDEITFLVSVAGKVQTKSYKHLEDHKLPPHLKDLYLFPDGLKHAGSDS